MNSTPATGKRRGSSGFIRPEFYVQAKMHKADVCKKTTGYSLMDYADNVEKHITSGDYRILYKHFFYADKTGNLKFRDSVDTDTN
jgi:hypothetical protein